MGVAGYVDQITQVGTDNDSKMIGAGAQHSVAIKNDGSIWVWGTNYDGNRLGDGGPNGTVVPTPKRLDLAGDWGGGVLSVAFGGTTIPLSGGSLWTWGRGSLFPARKYIPAFSTGLALHGDAETPPPPISGIILKRSTASSARCSKPITGGWAIRPQTA